MAHEIPEIRFTGFADPWERRKWIETVEISTEMVNPASGKYDNMPHIAPGNIESFTGRILDNVKTVKEEQLISGKFRFRPGDVVYGKINPQLGKYFYADLDGLTSADAYVLKGKNGITQKFLFSLLQTEDFFKYSVSVSKRSGMPKINRDELNAYSFWAPCEEEQIQIGTFLLGIDRLITILQRKVEKLQQFKKAMLAKMFPQDGARVPEIRFAGFTDDWERRKVSEMFKITRGYVLPATETSETINDEMMYPVYSSQTQDNGLMGYYSDYLYEDAITWTTDGANAGTVNFRNGKFYCTNVCGVLLSNEIEASKAIAEALNSVAKRYVSYVGNPKLMNNVMAEILIAVPPSEKERKQISLLFSSFDNMITLYRRKVEKLQKFKKAMLAKMFV